MSLEMYGTDVIGRFFIKLLSFIAKKLGISRGGTLLLFLGILTISVFGFTVYDTMTARASIWNDQAVTAQACIGGLGMGAVTTPYWCWGPWDPRMEAHCYCRMEPVAGGYCYCPYHSLTLTYLEESPTVGGDRLRLAPPGENEWG